jgi:hypothetical protein
MHANASNIWWIVYVLILMHLYISVSMYFMHLHCQPTDGGGLKDSHHNWTNSILQQLLPLQFSTGPSKLFNFPEIVNPPPSVGGYL